MANYDELRELTDQLCGAVDKVFAPIEKKLSETSEIKNIDVKEKMRLEHEHLSDYVCDLTKDLDKWAGLDTNEEDRDWLYHYLMVDDFALSHKCLPLRVPGGTVGGVWYDEFNRISKIDIDTNYVIKTYPENIKALISEKYVGTVINFEGVNIK